MKITCKLCNKEFNGKPLELFKSAGVEYSLFQCEHCNVQMWFPFKNPGADWYEHDERYLGANKSPSLEPNWNHKKTISYFKDKIGDVLDIGCGTGNFLGHAKENGWTVTGIDFDSNAVNTARNIFKISDVSVDDLYSFQRNNTKLFDLITFFDVFEHIDDHNNFLNTVRKLLKKEGHIAMSMPYRGGARWLQPNDLPPRHLTRWNRNSLENVLNTNGFSIVYVRRVPVEFFTIVMKLRFKYGKKTSFGFVGKIKAQSNKKTTGQLLKIKIIHYLAKIKDILLFGIPAVIVWFMLLFSEKKYTGLYVIAKKI